MQSCSVWPHCLRWLSEASPEAPLGPCPGLAPQARVFPRGFACSVLTVGPEPSRASLSGARVLLAPGLVPVSTFSRLSHRLGHWLLLIPPRAVILPVCHHAPRAVMLPRAVIPHVP